MRGVAFIRRPVWLAIILLSALPRIGVMAQDITPHSLGALPSPPVASAFATRPPQVRSFALMPEPDGRTAQLKIEFSKDARLPKELELQLDKPVLFRPAADNTATAHRVRRRGIPQRTGHTVGICPAWRPCSGVQRAALQSV